ncbi:hypothetical protein BH09BAC3_BH09BAC3_19070 [soil metagenome]
MKTTLILLLFPTIVFCQSITGIKTEKQAGDFVKENFKYCELKYDEFIIDSVNSRYDCFKAGDFNHDGIKDLLLFGKAHVTKDSTVYKEDEIAIILGDRKKPRKVIFSYGFFSRFEGDIIPYPRAISIGNKDYVLIRYDITEPLRQTVQTHYDTFFIKNDHVIPFASKPSNKIVTSIEFKTTRCFGTCPVFELKIDENLDGMYRGIEYVDRKGEYKITVEDKDWVYLTSLIKNLKVENLKDEYDVEWSDCPTVFLTIRYKDGYKKTVTDYGPLGSFGLCVLYDYLYELARF